MEDKRFDCEEAHGETVRRCKKCGEPLAGDSTFDECDACRMAWAEKGKKALKVLGAVGAAVASIAWIAIKAALDKKDE